MNEGAGPQRSDDGEASPIHQAALCAFSGNPVFEQIKAEGEELPRRIPRGINSLNEEEVRVIMRAAEEIGGWQGEVARFITAMYPTQELGPQNLVLHISKT